MRGSWVLGPADLPVLFLPLLGSLWLFQNKKLKINELIRSHGTTVLPMKAEPCKAARWVQQDMKAPHWRGVKPASVPLTPPCAGMSSSFGFSGHQGRWGNQSPSRGYVYKQKQGQWSHTENKATQAFPAFIEGGEQYPFPSGQNEFIIFQLSLAIQRTNNKNESPNGVKMR